MRQTLIWNTYNCNNYRIFILGVFEYQPAEYDAGDEEAEMDEDPLLETGDYFCCYTHQTGFWNKRGPSNFC